MQQLCAILVLGSRHSKLFSRQDLRVRARGLVEEVDILRSRSEYALGGLFADFTQGEMRKNLEYYGRNRDINAGFRFVAIFRFHSSSPGK
jgi:hypothetical protein